MYKMKNKKIIFFCLLVLISGFLRFYKLSEYPIQLNHDEISQAYDTASIVKTGKDIYGNYLPLVFPSTGDYKVGHYIYLSTFPYKVFGNQEFTIRVASAFFGTLTIIAIFLFVIAFTKNFWLAFSSAFLVTFTPSEIFYSRKSFENVIGVTLVFFGLYCLFRDLNEEKNNLLKCLGIFLMSSAMYVYTSHTIVVPLLLLFYAISIRNQIIREYKKYILLLLFWIFLISPLIINSFLNSDLRFRAASVFVTQNIDLGRQLNLSQNNFKTYMDFIFIRYLNQFNPVYLFSNGLNLTNQGFIGLGPLLLIQLPLVLLGFIFIIRKSNFSAEKRFFFFGLLGLPIIPSVITFEPFSPHRSMLEFTVLSVISGFGLYWLVQKRNILINILIFSCISFNLIFFLNMYTVGYPFEKSQEIHYPFKNVVLYAISQQNNFDKIIIDPTYGEIAPVYGVAMHYYLAYYGNFSPETLQRELQITKEGMVFKKFHIRKINWRVDQDLKNILFIGSEWSLPLKDIDKSRIINKFNFYNGQVAFYAIKL